MADALPPLGGLTVNTPPGRLPPPPPPVFPMRDLPLELTDMVLASYLAKLEVGELCEAKLLQICRALRGINQCNDPDDPLWKAACARFGLTERLVGGTPDAPATPTWHVTFLAMCNEVATLEPHQLEVYKGLLRGEDAYTDGPFSDSDDSEDDDAHVTVFTAPPRRRLRGEVQALWRRALTRRLSCMVHFLLALGADINGKYGGGIMKEVPLVRASRGGDLADVEFLLAHGADVHVGDDGALRSASLSGHLPVLKVLLAHGANVHAANDAALKLASWDGHLAVVEVLLAHGADVHALDRRGHTALLYASREGHAAVVEALRAAGAL